MPPQRMTAGEMWRPVGQDILLTKSATYQGPNPHEPHPSGSLWLLLDQENKSRRPLTCPSPGALTWVICGLSSVTLWALMGIQLSVPCRRWTHFGSFFV